jgi:GST-like protein
MESGVILMYLAAKTGKFDGENEMEKWKVKEWLMWQMAGFGPMLGMPRNHY